MAYNVKIKFSLGQQAAVEFGHQDRFLFKVRACQEFTERADNAASSARKHGVRFFTECGRVIFGEVATPVELVAAQDKAASLSGNMLHGRRPHGAMVGGGRTINFNALRIHEGT